MSKDINQPQEVELTTKDFLELEALRLLLGVPPDTPAEPLTDDKELLLEFVVERTPKAFKFIIRPKDHGVPHFHVWKGGEEASFAIADCSRLAGDGFKRDEKHIRKFHEMYKDALIKKWEEFYGEFVE